jgi:hypothetical protein
MQGSELISLLSGWHHEEKMVLTGSAKQQFIDGLSAFKLHLSAKQSQIPVDRYCDEVLALAYLMVEYIGTPMGRSFHDEATRKILMVEWMVLGGVL